MSEEQKKTNWISETVFLTFMTILAYAIVIRYDEGFCDHFGVPRSMIAPSLAAISSVLSDFIYFAIVPVLIVESCFTITWIFFKKGFNDTKVKSVFYSGAYSIWFGLLAESWTIFIGLLLFATLITFFVPDQTREGDSDLINLPKDGSLLGIRTAIIGYIIPKNKFHHLLLIVFLFLGVTASTLGERSARKQKTFLIPKSNPDYVVVRQYGERFVLAKFDRASKKVLDELIVLNAVTTDLANPVSFKLEKVGPLLKSEP